MKRDKLQIVCKRAAQLNACIEGNASGAHPINTGPRLGPRSPNEASQNSSSRVERQRRIIILRKASTSGTRNNRGRFPRVYSSSENCFFACRPIGSNAEQFRGHAPITNYLVFDDFDPRNARRNRRIASNKNRTTSAIAAAGAANASKDIKSAPPSSVVAMTGFPRPPVKTVE